MNFGAPFRIGIISDTHGLLRPEVEEIFRGADHILHAGDVGDAEILRRLAAIAPVTAVRGNTDVAPAFRSLPLCEAASFASADIFMHHGHLDEFNILPRGANVLVSGHTHLPMLERGPDGVIYLNPGSVSLPKGGNLPSFGWYDGETLRILELSTGKEMKRLALREGSAAQ